MTLIDGKAISEQVKQEIAAEVAEIVYPRLCDCEENDFLITDLSIEGDERYSCRTRWR